MADYIGGWVTGGGCQGDPTLHTTGFYQNSCLLLRQRTEYALQRKVLQCNGLTFVCATVQRAVCSVVWVHRTSCPFPPLPCQREAGHKLGPRGEQGGAGKDFSFLFRFIPHIIFPILQICYLVSNRDRWRVQMRNSSCNSCNMNPPMQDLGFFC